MFIGHYAAGLALKSVEKKASLGMLFIAVQLADILFFTFVLLGIEKFNLVENFTAVNHLDLYYYPYSHSLVGTLFLAILIYGLWRYLPLFKKAGNGRVAFVMALAVLSHWFLDYLVHIPDLPLFTNGGPKVGLGLWNNFYLSVSLEVLLFAGGLTLYLRATRPNSNMGKYAMIISGLFAVGLYIIIVTMPFDPSVTAVTASVGGLVLYGLFTIAGFWLDRYRT